MNRIVPTFVGGAVILMLMFRSIGLESGAAHDAVNNSSAPLTTADKVFQAIGGASGTAFPVTMLIAAIAFVLAVGVVVSR
jgi:hypothetical protein